MNAQVTLWLVIHWNIPLLNCFSLRSMKYFSLFVSSAFLCTMPDPIVFEPTIMLVSLSINKGMYELVSWYFFCNWMLSYFSGWGMFLPLWCVELFTVLLAYIKKTSALLVSLIQSDKRFFTLSIVISTFSLCPSCVRPESFPAMISDCLEIPFQILSMLFIRFIFSLVVFNMSLNIKC